MYKVKSILNRKKRKLIFKINKEDKKNNDNC